MISAIFHDLLTQYKTWTALSEFLMSETGGSLRIYDRSTPEVPFALIRYVKGKSNMSLPHVRAFRSVVWDTLENRPVSVTPFKSEDGETLPTSANDSTVGYTVERFLDGVMIGSFWDRYNNHWRIHTRSTLDATSRYYSQDKTFKQMFDEFLNVARFNWDSLDKAYSYTWVLQHPENRIVVPVTLVGATIVQRVKVGDSSVTVEDSLAPLHVQSPMPTWTDVRARLADWNTRFKHTAQGLVVKETATGRRWKIRTGEYNRVRLLRTNTPRRDYLWLTLWRSGDLKQYLTLFPEERGPSDILINKWKRVTNDVFHFYKDVFKARSLDKKQIPAKYRPFVFGLHGVFIETLKPAGKTVVWKSVLDYMNGRDVAQMLYALNWDLRESLKKSGVTTIPIEPQSSVGTEVSSNEQPSVIFKRKEHDDEDMPDLVPVSELMAEFVQTATPVAIL